MHACPEKVGPYEVEKTLGEGPYTRVCLARETTPMGTRRVVLKGPKVPEQSPAFREQMTTWAGLANDPRYPRLRGMLHWVEAEDRNWAVLEYAAAGSLAARLDEVLALPPMQKIRLLEQVAQALDDLHAASFVYAALRPENILFREWNEEGPEAMLAEPGFRPGWRWRTKSGTGSETIQPSTLVGSHARPYLSPEEAEGREPTPASDCFALASLAYHLLTGQLPFGENPYLTLTKPDATLPPTPPSEARPEELTAEVDAVFQWGMARRPEARPDSCRAFVLRLQQALKQQLQQALEEARQALAQQDAETAAQALERAGNLVGTGHPELAQLQRDLEKLQQALEAYREAQEARETARRLARELVAQHPELPDYAGVRARLATASWRDRLALWWRRYRPIGLTLAVLTGLLVLALLLYVGTHTTQTPGFQTPAAWMGIWTSSPTLTPSPTSTFTLTPTLTPTSTLTLTPTPSPTLTPTFTSTPTHTPTFTPSFTPTPPWPLLELTPNPPLRVIKADNASNLKLLRSLEGHERTIHSIAFSYDSAFLASASADGTIRLWQTLDGSSIPVSDDNGNHKGVYYTIAFSPNNLFLASGSGGWQNNTIKLWQIIDGALVLVKAERSDVPIFSIAFSPDGILLASGASKASGTEKVDTGRLWRLSIEGLIFLKTLQEDNGAYSESIFSLAFSPDGTLLASGAADKTVRLWRVADGTQLDKKTHTDWIRSVAFSPDGAFLAAGAKDGTVQVWRISGDVLQPFLPKLETDTPVTEVHSVAFSPDGHLLAAGSENGFIYLWAFPEGTLVKKEQMSSSVVSVAFSPDGRILATGSEDGIVRLWAVP